MDPSEFIRGLEIAPVPGELESLANTSLFQNATLKTDEEQSFVNERSLVSFAAAVPPKNRQDILDTVLLASLAAEKAHPENSDPNAWFDRFVEVLTKIGWATEKKEERSYSNEAKEFDVNKAVLKILGTVLPGPVGQIALIKSTLDALEKLADDDGKIRVFESRAKQLETANFQVGMANFDNEALSLSLSNFTFQNVEGSKKVLFFRWGKDVSELRYKFFQASFNSNNYSGFRHVVKQKLGKKTEVFIQELDI